MNRDSVRALIIYLQRAHGIIPTTLADGDAMRPAMQALEAIANGQVTATLAAITEPAAETQASD